jgi:hypothetical protein
VNGGIRKRRKPSAKVPIWHESWPGLAQAAGQPLVLAAGRLAIDEQPKPILATEFAGIGGVVQLERMAATEV